MRGKREIFIILDCPVFWGAVRFQIYGAASAAPDFISNNRLSAPMLNF
jgi:hypothetical protein